MEHDTQQYRNKDLSLMECPYFIFIYLPENLGELNYYY